MPTPDPTHQPPGWISWVLGLGGFVTGLAALVKAWFNGRAKVNSVAVAADGQRHQDLKEYDHTVWSRMEKLALDASARADQAEKRADRAERQAFRTEHRVTALEARVTELETELEAARTLLALRDKEIRELKNEIERLVTLTVDQSQAYQAQELHYMRTLEEDRKRLAQAEAEAEELRLRIAAMEAERAEVLAEEARATE